LQIGGAGDLGACLFRDPPQRLFSGEDVSRNNGKRLIIPTGTAWLPIAIVLVSLAGSARLANAQEKTIGGHAGFGFPLVTHDGDNTSTLGDTFQMSLPVAITVNGSGRMYFDLELVPIRRGQAKRNSTCCKSRAPVAAGARLCRWKPRWVPVESGSDEDGAIRNHAADRQELADRTQLLQELLCGR